MITAIVVDDTGCSATVLDKVVLLGEIKTIAETLIVSSDPKPEGFTDGEWILDDSLVGGLQEAVRTAATKRVLIISSSVTFDSPDLARFMAEVETSPLIEHLYLAPRTDDGIIELPDISPNAIIQSLARYENWPLVCLATTRLSITALTESNASTTTELLVTSLLRSIADGDAIRRSTAAEPVTTQSMLRAVSELDTEARARILTCAVDAMNIEELFPNHAWQDFSQESAAAVYHTLAALFIRFGDTDSAAQCLGYSERLEESPRYFALKGLIQHTKGETLGAVANMVSSLQCYETRKVSDGKHYISFKPKNLEVIASRLVDGLNALNRQDNDKALTHFSEAIFNFDSFYSDTGVHSLDKIRQ